MRQERWSDTLRAQLSVLGSSTGHWLKARHSSRLPGRRSTVSSKSSWCPPCAGQNRRGATDERVRNVEGVATHNGSEPCVGGANHAGEALTATPTELVGCLSN